MAFGALHMCVRLHVMLTTRENVLWRQPMLGWPDDRTDISMQAITRTCLRGAGWAANSVLIEPMSEGCFHCRVWFKRHLINIR